MTAIEIPFLPVKEITRSLLHEYADASADHNLIHLDDEIARKMGLPGVIAHGMLIAAMLGERGMQYFRDAGGGQGFVTRFTSRFKAMVQPGDHISVGGTVKSQAATEWILELQAKNQKDEVTTSATMTIAVVS